MGGRVVTGQKMTRTSETCPECGTTQIKFDPPLVFEPSEICGQSLPGNWSASATTEFDAVYGIKVVREGVGYVHCEMHEGHEGQHVYLVESLIKWGPV
jgi:hypothetical protein